MKRLASYFSPRAPWTFVYMLQQVEYDPHKFLLWSLHLPKLFSLQKRGGLVLTKRAQLMLIAAYIAWFLPVVLAVSITLAWSQPLWLLLVLLAPFISILTVYDTTYLLQRLIINPKQNAEIARARDKLDEYPATRIAILGSYGKTSFKELLATILSHGMQVAATPGNKNVLISHARWINQLKEGNKVLIFEYGEGKPGDIKKLADFSLPHYGIITGLAPAHLDAYASLEAVADDFAYMNAAVGAPNLYINGTSELLRAKLDGNYYDQSGIPGWRTDDIKINFSGTDFTLSNQDRKLELHTGLLGKHQVGPLSAAVALAAKLGLNDKHIIAGVAATVPFEHRMQPRQLHGAWIIDDTYNGNIEGMRAGLELLATLPGKRKIYVTPGLVDQGEETEKIHHELGTLIATAQPDKVVLMNNSVADYISASMHAGRFKGELVVEKDPLGFYTNIEHYVAAGDVILLQNDWPDSYQ